MRKLDASFFSGLLLLLQPPILKAKLVMQASLVYSAKVNYMVAFCILKRHFSKIILGAQVEGLK